ncbi:UTRA domain-containing protein [Klebsiella pneumoniae subsp. pneumoniae]|nr:UTRA domain-containing protein [Klebsiella pneumoniae subsp. pneumoniae]
MLKKSAISPSSRATAAIPPVLATREQAELLQVAPNSLLLRVQSISYAQNRAIVDFSEIYQNTSKYNVKHITRR